MSLCVKYLLPLLMSMAATVAHAQPMAPQYEECRLDSIFPNGARRGTSVTVEFRGMGSGLSGAKDIIIDGPRGISVGELKEIKGHTLQATLSIAADAPLGRRWLRVLNERSGLTNFACFVVGDLPEFREAEPNQDVATAQVIAEEKGVINGRIEKPADQDLFRISGRAGEKFVAAIAAHALDVHGQRKDYGIADFSLELLSSSGQVIAAAEDTIGFDPLIETTLPADGEYLLRVQLLNYAGFPEAVYRLTFGEVAYPLAAFPSGLARQGETEVELIGPNIPPGKRWKFAAVGDFPQQFVTAQDVAHAGLDVPMISSERKELLESEPNDDRAHATPLATGATANGRFGSAGDADFYKITVVKGERLWLEIHAHRYLRSPVDTLLQVFDAQGKLVAENDDEAFDPGYESYHDFKTTDSKLLFTAPAAGDYFVRVSEQTEANGARAIYRLSVSTAEPDVRLTHFPDAVPIWGPGSTAAVLVRIDRLAGCDEDVELCVEGLPEGWSSSRAVSLGNHGVRSNSPYQLKVFLTITAPTSGTPGTAVPFRIVGRFRRAGGEPIERISQPLNLYYTSDTGFFRVSPQSRAAIAKPQGPWLESLTKELNLSPGASSTISVRVHNLGEFKNIPLVVNLATSGVACSLGPPQPVPVQDGVAQVALKLPAEMQPGTYQILVSQSWRSDIRIGMPGPCTAGIQLTVTKP